MTKTSMEKAIGLKKFTKDGEVGCLYIEDGKLKFEGDMEESAKIFIEEFLGPMVESVITKDKAEGVREWISVKDGLPEEGVTVLVNHQTRLTSQPWENKVMTAYIRNGKWYMANDNSGYGLCDHQTHWQPLLEPPRED